MLPMLGALLPAVMGAMSSPMISMGASALFGGAIPTPLGIGKMVVSQLVQNALGQMGLPPVVTKMLQDGIESTLGPGLPGNPGTNENVAEFVAEAFGVDLADANNAIQDLSELVLELVTKMMEDFRKKEQEEEKAEAGGAGGGGEAGGASGGSGGGSWIMQIAEKMGEIVDQKFEEMKTAVDALANATEKSKGEGSAAEDAAKDVPSLSVKAQGKTQEFNMVMQAATTVVKTSGTAAGQAASRN